MANSRWRRERLLILCYHGTSLEDEHEWRPQLYMQPELLDQRLEALRAMRCTVLPLGEALERLRTRDLPPRSVAITFDDGTYDFYQRAYPLLKKHGVPVTVYQTTYYSDHEMPIFNLICSYMLWKRRDDLLGPAPEIGVSDPMDLRTEGGRHRVVRALIDRSERENLTGIEKNEVARKLAGILGIDFDALTAKRILQLMNAREVGEIAKDGVDVELHTHRHRAPDEEAPFRREIAENRMRIEAFTGRRARHFCYPSGVYRKEFFTWLAEEDIASATTCDAGLVARDDNPLVLSRFVDTSGRTQVEFESWLSGVGSLIAVRRVTPQRYILPEE
ncbi:MAG TPA: polysaccharide deacetylase family protein [Candidatus Dormibacteraeota bacterium]|nr:polysaccharide deacetylase family protein [Candidatus Dormibacteraeota bacterium]